MPSSEAMDPDVSATRRSAFSGKVTAVENPSITSIVPGITSADSFTSYRACSARRDGASIAYTLVAPARAAASARTAKGPVPRSITTQSPPLYSLTRRWMASSNACVRWRPPYNSCVKCRKLYCDTSSATPEYRYASGCVPGTSGTPEGGNDTNSSQGKHLNRLRPTAIFKNYNFNAGFNLSI
jgi:hypothetical protein